MEICRILQSTLSKKTFIGLLTEHPLNEISVKMIVENCGINRKSFYYHYRDIPALTEEIFRDKTDYLIEHYREIRSVEECLYIAANYMLKSKRYIRHICYGSSSNSTFERYLLNICDYFVRFFVNAKAEETDISDSDRDIIAALYRGEIYGLLSAWLMNGMKEDILTDLARLFNEKHTQPLLYKGIERQQFFADLSPFARYCPFSSLKFRRLSVLKYCHPISANNRICP